MSTNDLQKAGDLRAYEQVLLNHGLHLVSPQDDDIHPEAMDLVKGLVSRGVGFMVAEPAAGKTLLAMNMALHLCLGRSWLGRKTRKVPVFYIATEDGVGVKRRALAAARALGLPAKPDNLYLACGRFQLTDRKALKDIAELLKQLGSEGLVVIDTLANACVGLDENSSTSGIGIALEAMADLHRETRWTVMALHHTAKSSAGGKPVARGSGAILGRAEFELGVKKNSSTGEVELSVGKMKDGESGQSVAAFRIEPFLLGVDSDGDPIHSSIVRVLQTGIAQAAAPSLTGKVRKSGERARAVLDQIRQLQDIDGWVELRALCDAVATSAAMAGLQGDSIRRTVLRVLDDLSSSGRIELDVTRKLVRAVGTNTGQADRTSEIANCPSVRSNESVTDKRTGQPPSLEGVVSSGVPDVDATTKSADVFDITKLRLPSLVVAQEEALA